MRLRLPLVALLLVTLFGCAKRTKPPIDRPADPASGSASLSVTILGLESDEGLVALALYDSAESFKQRSGAVITGRVNPSDGKASWFVDDLPPGIYAVAVYHDLNGNGELDRSTLGPPDEPYGFSNDARGTFGPPKFDNAAIELESSLAAIEINVR